MSIAKPGEDVLQPIAIYSSEWGEQTEPKVAGMAEAQRADDRVIKSKTKRITTTISDKLPLVRFAPRHVHGDPSRRFDFFEG